MKVSAYLTFVILLYPSSILAQNVTLSRNTTGVAGGEKIERPVYAEASFKLWYTVGQSSPINRLAGIDHELWQGFQQPFGSTLKTIVAIKTNAIPNPSEGLFELTIQDELVKPVTMKCLTLNGIVVYETEIDNPITQLNLMHLSNGLYMIKLYSERKKYETLKIILK